MDQRKTVLVLGGTGHNGRHIVRSLAAKGEPVRVLTRSATRARGILTETVEVVEDCRAAAPRHRPDQAGGRTTPQVFEFQLDDHRCAAFHRRSSSP